jgi:hypothetical protein
VSGKRVTFVGDAMAAVVRGVEEVRILIGQPPVVVGGLAVMCRLASPYRATTDLDVVDRLLGTALRLQVLGAARGRVCHRDAERGGRAPVGGHAQRRERRRDLLDRPFIGGYIKVKIMSKTVDPGRSSG